MISFFSNVYMYHFGTTKAIVILFFVSIILLPITYVTSLYHSYSIPLDTIYSHTTFIVFQFIFDRIFFCTFIGVYYHLAKNFDQSSTKFRVKSAISALLLVDIILSLLSIFTDVFHTPLSLSTVVYISLFCLLILLPITYILIKHFWKSTLCIITPFLASLSISFMICTFFPFLLDDLPVTIAETYYSQGCFNQSAAILEKYIGHYNSECSECKELLNKCYKELGIHSID